MKKSYTIGKLFKHFRVIHSHPTTRGRWFAAMRRTFSWLFAWKILRFSKLIFPYLEHSELVAPVNTIGCAGAYICSIYEYEDMSFLLHFLRKDDLFFDIGANVGWFTVLAGKECGCNVVSFEPIPKTFSFLKLNVVLNSIESNVSLRNVGCGSEKGILLFTSDKDVENRVVISSDESTSTVSVDITTIDIESIERCPTVIKIDVEGFETSVLSGAKSILGHNDLKVILVELAGHGKKYGFNEDDIRRDLIDAGFQPIIYDPCHRKIIPIDGNIGGGQNTIFVRDMRFVETRIKTGPLFNLFGKQQ